LRFGCFEISFDLFLLSFLLLSLLLSDFEVFLGFGEVSFDGLDGI